jgi:hypothetical protein
MASPFQFTRLPPMSRQIGQCPRAGITELIVAQVELARNGQQMATLV